jgi:hypothetical protein
VRRQAKASSAGSIERQATVLGRRACAAGAVSLGAAGSGACQGGPLSGLRYRGALLVAALLAFALLALAPSAEATKYVSERIGNSGSTGGLLDDPRGVAVHQASGDVYVVDAGNQRVQQFDADRDFIRVWGADVIVSGEPNDNGTGFEICDTTAGNEAADCKKGIAGTQGGMFSLRATANCGTIFQPESNCRGGIAVNQTTGDVYVTDRFNLRVQQFTSTGAFVRAWGQDVDSGGGPGFEVCAVAADCKVGVSGSAGGAIGDPGSTGGFVDRSHGGGHPAVVPAGAPNAGNVLIPDPANRRVQEFTANGGFVRAFGADVETPAGGTALEVCTTTATCKEAAPGGGPSTPAGQFGAIEPKRVAADTTGAIYTVEQGFEGGVWRVQRFTPQAGAPGLGASLFSPGVLSASDSSRTPVDIAVDPADNRVYVVKVVEGGASTCADGKESLSFERRIFELSAAGVLLDTHLECAGFTSNNEIFGLALDGDRLLFSAQQRVYVADDVGITPAIAAVDAVTGVTADSAEVDATVNPNSVDNDFAPTVWRLQLSTDGLKWSTFANGTVPAGTVGVPISATADNLLANTGYQVRVVTQKPFANPEVPSPDASFTTLAVPPDVAAVRADSIGQTSARLTAQVTPRGAETDYRFEWGQGGLGNVVPVPDGPVGSGHSSVFVAEQLTGLQPGTTYQFRLVATNLEGPTTSATKTFTTATAPPDPQGRAYELVSPAYKFGGTGVGQFYRGIGTMASSGFAAWRGERFAALGDYGSTLLGTGGFAAANDWAFVERSGDSVGWQSHSPITHPSFEAEHAQFFGIRSSSDDLSAFLWGAANTWRLFPEMEKEWGSTANGFFLSDWGSPPAAPTRWELFGPDSLSEVEGASGVPTLWVAVKFSADGSTAAGVTGLTSGSPKLPLVPGLAGPGDPTARSFGDLVSGRSIYLVDMTQGLTDAYAIGERTLANVCTGAGAARTQVPAIDGSADLGAEACPAPELGRDSRLVSDHGATLAPGGGFNDSLAGTVSGDGSRVFFLAPDPAATGTPNGTSQFCSGTGAATLCPPQLFVREETPDGPVVRWISKAEDGLFGSQDASLTGAVRFEGSTPDGDKVFFRTNSPLTADDPNGSGAPAPGGVTSGNPSSDSWDLYRYDFPDAPGADPGDGELTRISAGPNADGDCNSPRVTGSEGIDTIGALRAHSDDGDRAYFTCAAPLPGVVAPSDPDRLTAPGGTPTTDDMTNLYLYDADLPQAERWGFVARLPRTIEDTVDACASTGTIPKSPFNLTNDATTTGLQQASSSDCVETTADGSFVTFMTMARLTRDDDVVPPTGDIYGYDVNSDELVRVTAPQGGDGEPQPCATSLATPLCWGGGSIDSAGSEASGGRVPTGLGLATHPLVDGDRIAFFHSPARLLPADNDDAWDVYQWRNGRLSLVSTGASTTDGALYKGNDRTGRNVYMVTRDRLSWQDTDAVADIYTARVGGGIPQPPPPAICDVLAGACEGSSSGDPADLGAGTAAFEGPGNAGIDGSADRCAKLAGNARKTARNAKRNRGAAKRYRRLASRSQGRRAAVLRRRAAVSQRRARRAAGNAKRTSRAAKRCRRGRATATDRRAAR